MTHILFFSPVSQRSPAVSWRQVSVNLKASSIQPSKTSYWCQTLTSSLWCLFVIIRSVFRRRLLNIFFQYTYNDINYNGLLKMKQRSNRAQPHPKHDTPSIISVVFASKAFRFLKHFWAFFDLKDKIWLNLLDQMGRMLAKYRALTSSWSTTGLRICKEWTFVLNSQLLSLI